MTQILLCPICQRTFKLNWKEVPMGRVFDADCIHYQIDLITLGCWIFGNEDGLFSYTINFKFDGIIWSFASDKIFQSTGIYLMDESAGNRTLYESTEFVPLKDAKFYYDTVQRFVNLKAFL